MKTQPVYFDDDAPSEAHPEAHLEHKPAPKAKPQAKPKRKPHVKEADLPTISQNEASNVNENYTFYKHKIMP